MPRIKTVRVKSGDGYAIINEDDFDPDVHELMDDSAVATANYVEIPNDWESMHWKRQVALAKAIFGGDVADKDTAGVIILEESERRESI